MRALLNGLPHSGTIVTRALRDRQPLLGRMTHATGQVTECTPMHTVTMSLRLHLDAIDDNAVVTEARREQRATESAAAIERDRIGTFDQTAVPAIESAHDAPVRLVRLEQLDEGPTAPPERIALQIERLRRIEAGMNKKQCAVIR